MSRSAPRHFAVVGHPIAHSRSPQIFDALAEASGIELAYERLDLAPHEFAATFARAHARYHGWNVTAPHKERAIAAADDVSAEAAIVGAANVVTFRDGRAYAANTDVEGVSALFTRAGVDVRGVNATVLGAGGAARATVLALAHGGAASVTIVNRTPERARALHDDLRAATGTTSLLLGEIDEGTSLLVNATSDGGAVTWAIDACDPDGWCIDLQYKPAPTPFVAAAHARGRNAIDGAYMLVAQALATFRLWFGDVAFDPGVAARLTALVEAP